MNLKELDEKLEKIMDKLNRIESILTDKIETQTKTLIENIHEKDEEDKEIRERLNDHIDLIEEVYDTVKSPLGFILDKFKHITDGHAINTTRSIKL